ncbi:MAG: glycogen debranching protein GlgX [Deltaproteobacteria bacterium]|jgi:isoamylase|nr:glycogen debranching protein GlgX [Deltaproteobacteria bacterium]
MIPDLIESNPGMPMPLGVSRIEKICNFAIFVPEASDIKLNIFDSDSEQEIFTYQYCPEINKTGTIWHMAIGGLPDRFLYTYQISGISKPSEGILFFPEHHLIDPYAKSIHGLEKWGRDPEDPTKRIFNEYIESKFDWQGDLPLQTPWNQLIIYELHTRGFTQKAPIKHPGTFSGLIEQIDYLKELGITAIELLPIHEFDEADCPFFNPETGEQLLSTWGYSSINFFALRSAFAADSKKRHVIDEFKEMVKQFHRAGIEVIIDVVFNHSAERDHTGPVFNYKGIANSTYYILDQAGDYFNFSGCGNTLNCNHPVVAQMILEALRYWVVEMHVDGFRFDLASIMTRDQQGNVLSNPPVVEIIAKDPVLANTKIIAEAWDAVGLYQVGDFPAHQRWAEWNGKYRDILRRFCIGTTGLTGEVASRLSGSEDMYQASGRKPYHSINFITAHDGFPMMDLVSYNEKHNMANGENNRDGGNDNFSYNFGVEGPTDNSEIIHQRKKQIFNYITLLMISQGTPMILAGDEFGRSQGGNNNVCFQDNELFWLDWNLLEPNRDIFNYWKHIIQFRKKHPVLHRENYFTGKIIQATGSPDISWHNRRLNQPEFGHTNSTLAFLIDGCSVLGKVDDHLYVIVNFSKEDLDFEIPIAGPDNPWLKIIDTSAPEPYFKIPSIVEKTSVSVTFSIQIFQQKAMK